MTHFPSYPVALALWLGLLAWACWFCWVEVRLMRARKAMDAAIKPQLIVDAQTVNAHEALEFSATWTWDGSCHLCAARLTTAAHYIVGNRVVCPDCAGVMKEVA